MAEILSERPEDEEITDPAPQEDNPEPKEDLPEKYKGKSMQELVQMHQEAERLIGKQGQETGELRKIVDDFIKSQTQLAPEKKPAEEVDIFTDPDKYVSKAIESHPDFQELKKTTTETKKAAALAAMKQRHPDMDTLLRDSKFLDWVFGSTYRTNRLREANDQYSVEAADELFTEWKERQKLLNETVQQDRKSQVRAASTGGKSGNADHSSRKIYRRADIIKLMIDDPKRYEALCPEIRQAYAEGRVK